MILKSCVSIFKWHLYQLCRKQYFLSVRFSSNVSDETRVVVTGLGIVCPLGVGVNHVWKQILKSQSAVSSIRDPAYSDIPCKVAAFIPQGENEGELNIHKFFKPSDFKKYSFSTICSLVAAEEAIADAAWFPRNEEELEYTGVAVGTGMIDLIDVVTAGNSLKDKGYRGMSPFFVPRILSNISAGHIAIKNGFKGPNHAVSTACATGLHAIGDAYNFIRNKQANVMICGSAEAVISPISIAGFSRMRALSTNFNDQPKKASRPFDKDRDGFVMGEGAGILVLESLSHAQKRKAKMYAEVLGYGLSGDAHHITSPPENGSGAYRCMKQALSQNSIKPIEVGYINAHATSTPLGDGIELKAIYDLFKEHSSSLVVSSTKGSTGHLLGAAGSVEAIFTIMSCFSKTIPPNVNLDNADINLPVNLAGKKSQSWPKKIQGKIIGLTNSFGFGGTNASILFSKSDYYL
ncbi:3-oxoacyl-[acyl-carrier-protein] synthase, mitochondrial [Trichonephila inaurata madagascariensis]|uniref:3-oxoacyl-[acyl-carrier-protein] synthase n=1 Tax=Trichonephila inaurata madagascariensis TaxID=2747483 RepID=A0A8X6Y1I8_9ARAC|nr:3-oxoacyl-[acyl-carrier-protein] synthase, mitochondrial [Trichonephila inaurata madagascariensis]